MARTTAVGVFESVDAAERARNALLAAGVPRECIVLSRLLTEDGIAAEFPGQSYEHQVYVGGGEETEHARFNEALRAGGCVVNVEPCAGVDLGELRRLLRQSGARATLHRPQG